MPIPAFVARLPLQDNTEAIRGEARFQLVPTMRRELFAYVEQIRGTDKYVDVSLREMLRTLMVKGKLNADLEVDVTDDLGSVVTAPVRLNIAGGPDRPLTSWTVALKLHNVRIDGVDHEFSFKTLEGTRVRGWHRHQWDSRAETAEHDKLLINDLDRVDTGEDLLRRSFSLLKISLNAVDYGLFDA